MPWLLLFLFFLESLNNFLNVAGTDDDLPPLHHSRVPKGGCTAGNGRSALVGSTPYPSICAENMEVQIHQLEKEAYLSVLRAFKAQADAITWVLLTLSL